MRTHLLLGLRNPLCPSGYEFVFPTSINNNGQIVGYSEGGGPEAGFWYDPAGCQKINFGNSQGIVFGLNDYAQVVGELSDAPYPGVILVPAQQ
jgi:probable HAF family extracellular repeat protein